MHTAELSTRLRAATIGSSSSLLWCDDDVDVDVDDDEGGGDDVDDGDDVGDDVDEGDDVGDDVDEGGVDDDTTLFSLAPLLLLSIILLPIDLAPSDSPWLLFSPAPSALLTA